MKKTILMSLILLLGLQKIKAQKSFGFTVGYSNPVDYKLSKDEFSGFTGTYLSVAYTGGSLIGFNYKAKNNRNTHGVSVEFGTYKNSPYKDICFYTETGFEICNRHFTYNTININYLFEHVLKNNFMFGIETGLLLQTSEIMQETYIPKTSTDKFTHYSIGAIPKIGYYYPIKKSNFSLLGELKYKYNFQLLDARYQRIDNIGILVGVQYNISKKK